VIATRPPELPHQYTIKFNTPSEVIRIPGRWDDQLGAIVTDPIEREIVFTSWSVTMPDGRKLIRSFYKTHRGAKTQVISKGSTVTIAFSGNEGRLLLQ
jgi:hypothetical protein